MNWLVFTAAAYILYSLQLGLRGLLVIPSDPGGVAPSFVLVLMVFIGLQAQPMVVAWSALALGLAVDMIPGPDGLTIAGPAALGYLVGGFAVVQLRTLLFRDSTITLAIMVFAVGIFTNLTEVALYSFRQAPLLAGDALNGWSAPAELAHRFLQLVYTTVAAIPLGWVLLRSQKLWSFTRGERH